MGTGGVRGRPFKHGNSGRPRGSKNKTTQILEQLAEAQAEQLIRKAMELALNGDVGCIRILADRIWPVRKGQPLNINMPPIKSIEDALAAIGSILQGIGEGQLTADEAGALCVVVERSIQVIHSVEVVKRIEELEHK